MTGYSTICLSIAFCLAASAWLLRRTVNMRIVQLDNLRERLLWSVRVSRSKFPFPRNVKEWTVFVIEDIPCQFPGWRAWMLLRPFFSSRGYTLYDQTANNFIFKPPSKPPLAPRHLLDYPYARTIPGESMPEVDDIREIYLKNSSVWAARDELGRDVVIKLISDLDNPSDEWLVLKRLNNPNLRGDPANRTIHVIEFLTFDNFVFAVMPRWDCAFHPPFTKVSELMEATKQLLEGLDFLHRNRVAHLDIYMTNCGMNAYGGDNAMHATTSMRQPDVVKYIYYDFGYSKTYPGDTDIATISLDRHIRYLHAPTPTGPYNPFKVDVTKLAGLLYGFVMHAASTVPEIEPFLHRMMDLDENARLTASQALEEFTQIYASLSIAQLETSVNALWTNQKKTKYRLEQYRKAQEKRGKEREGA